MVQLNNYYNLKTIVCKTESLEMEKYNIPKKVGHYYPGASVKNPFSSSSTKNLFLINSKKYWNSFIGKIPKIRSLLLNPINVAFDTITVAEKPQYNSEPE